MNKIEIPALLTPEIISVINSNPDVLKTLIDIENNEETYKGLDHNPLECPNLSSLKVAFSNVNIHIKNTDFLEDICDERELESNLENSKNTCHRQKTYLQEVELLKVQLDKISEQVNEIKELLIQSRRNR